ncbi:MAG: trimethylamine methyltransferase family protein [archaeon]
MTLQQLLKQLQYIRFSQDPPVLLAFGLTPLKKSDFIAVHEASLDILMNQGVRVDSRRAADIYGRGRGISVVEMHEKDKTFYQVRFSARSINDALRTVPYSFDIFDGNGNKVATLGKDKTKCGIGVTNNNYLDPITHESTPFSLKNMTDIARLGNELDFQFISTPGFIHDIPPNQSELYGLLEMLANTDKPLVLLKEDHKQFKEFLDLVELIRGPQKGKPSILPYFNPVSPLWMNADTCEKMLDTIERGIPFIFSNYPLVGSQTPYETELALILMNAEILAGVALSQLTKKGTEIMLGSLPSYMPMKVGEKEGYQPESFKLAYASTQILKYYGIPTMTTSGAGRGWGGASGLGMINYVMNHMIAYLGNAALVPYTGSPFGSDAGSPSEIVLNNEIINMIERMISPFDFRDLTRRWKPYSKVQPGKNYLAIREGVKALRANPPYSNEKLFPNLSYTRWVEAGRPNPDKLLDIYTAELMAGLKEPEFYKARKDIGEAFIRTVF